MKQQSFLLIILATIVVGIAVAIGITLFGDAADPQSVGGGELRQNLDSLRAELKAVKEGDFLVFKGQLVCVRENRFREDINGFLYVYPVQGANIMVYPGVDVQLRQIGKIYRYTKQPGEVCGDVSPAWAQAAYRFLIN
ncbi:MAG: hypothetical protein AAB601_01715 [Patescibacteria group bacterium]